ncbi:MAG TPA: fumarylacetoacetate hydrolase family protein, partial [Mycobacterium sp.]
MKIARAVTRDGEDVVVEVQADGVSEVLGAKGQDLVDVCVTPDRWQRRGRTWDVNAGDVRFVAPVAVPPSIRDFSAYADHTRHVLEALGRELPASWFDEPVFYFSNPRAVIGPADPVLRPQGSRRLDYEAELAAVVGGFIDADTDDVYSALAGFTLMNDWSARDLAAREMKHSLGPAKGKDFATSLGPWVVTPDEFPTL